MGYKVIIAEKRSVGMDIARVIGANNRENGYMEGNGYIVSWARGHLFELKDASAYDPKYAKWRDDDLPIIPGKFEHKLSEGCKQQFDILKELMNRNDITEVINACDAGREGELIFRIIYYMAGCRKPMKRLWLSSMEDKAIREGFANLRSGYEYDNLYESAFCRSKADWLVGINLSRKVSLTYHRTLNVGRVKSPVLSMLADRQKEIDNFVSEPFYKVELTCDDFTATSDKMSDKSKAEEILRDCLNKSAVCKKVETKVKKDQAPLLYDLTALQRDANKRLGYSAKDTLNFAQSLYEKKLITYPRTDSRYVTEDMKDKLAETVRMCGHVLDNVFSIGYEDRLINSEKVKDHHALLPTEQVGNYDLTTLSEEEFNILKMIEQNVLMATSPQYEYESCKATLLCGGYEFTANYVRVLEYGWRLYVSKKEDDPVELSAGIKEDETYYVNNVSVKEGKTKPKAQYTEDTLLADMEKAGAKDMPDDAERKGLGTPATRAEIIESLITSGYVKRDKGKLVIQNVGKNLVEVLPDDLKSPMLTAEWENSLKKVEKGEMSSSDFMEGITNMVVNTVRDYKPVENADKLFPSNRETIGKCPRCGKDVTEERYRDGRIKGYFCEGIDCGFGLWKDNKFLAARHINLDRATAIQLINKPYRAKIPDILSLKSGKHYPGTLILDDDGTRISYRISV